MRPALVLVLVIACARDRGREEPPDLGPTDPSTRVANEACACKTLGCVDEAQHRLARIRDSSHGDQRTTAAVTAANDRINACAATLAQALERDIRALADAVCACPDRACYDALRPRVDAVFDSHRNGAALSPATVAEIKREAERFVDCDARFGASPPR